MGFDEAVFLPEVAKSQLVESVEFGGSELKGQSLSGCIFALGPNARNPILKQFYVILKHVLRAMSGKIEGSRSFF